MTVMYTCAYDVYIIPVSCVLRLTWNYCDQLHVGSIFGQMFFVPPFRYFFLEYSSAGEALEAVKTCDGYRLDKSHNFAVNLFTDFEK